MLSSHFSATGISNKQTLSLSSKQRSNKNTQASSAMTASTDNPYHQDSTLCIPVKTAIVKVTPSTNRICSAGPGLLPLARRNRDESVLIRTTRTQIQDRGTHQSSIYSTKRRTYDCETTTWLKRNKPRRDQLEARPRNPRPGCSRNMKKKGEESSRCQQMESS